MGVEVAAASYQADAHSRSNPRSHAHAGVPMRHQSAHAHARGHHAQAACWWCMPRPEHQNAHDNACF